MKFNENVQLMHSSFSETYMARTKRSAGFEYSTYAIDIYQAERRILQEMGPKACVMEEPCRHHAARPTPKSEQPDWSDILK